LDHPLTGFEATEDFDSGLGSILAADERRDGAT
jgi:hypothetical protein